MATNNIDVVVADKIATTQGTPVIVCGNSGYTITFAFDAEWDAEPARTARFVYCRTGERCYQDVTFGGMTVEVPVLRGIDEVYVGVYAGDLHTTTPARITCKRSILCDTPAHEDPPQDVYNQIMQLINDGLDWPDAIAAGVTSYIAAHPLEEKDPTVPDWAKAAQKPSYTAEEVGAAEAEHAHGNITKDGKIGTTKDRPVFTGTGGVLETKTPAAALTALGAAAADHTHNDMTSVGEKYTVTVEPDTADKAASIIRIKDNASGNTRVLIAANADSADASNEVSQIVLRDESNVGRIALQANTSGKKGIRIVDENGVDRIGLYYDTNENWCGFEIYDPDGNDITLDAIGAQGRFLCGRNQTIATSAWASDTTYADYPYRASVALPPITAVSFVEIVFSPTDASSGNFAPVCDTYAGGVYLYAKAVPDAAITIPTIIVWR